MKSLETWFEEYGVSHQNKLNKRIHYICVPAIFFSICGLLMSIPSSIDTGLHPIFNSWMIPIAVLVVLFYLRLSLSMGLKMLLFTAVCIVGNYLISGVATLWIVSLVIFVAAWIGQFYGHKVEGKKPSFLKDLQFLLIGPAWVVNDLFGN